MIIKRKFLTQAICISLILAIFSLKAWAESPNNVSSSTGARLTASGLATSDIGSITDDAFDPLVEPPTEGPSTPFDEESGSTDYDDLESSTTYQPMTAIQKQWEIVEERTQLYAAQTLSTLMLSLEGVFNSTTVSKTCQESIREVISDAIQLKQWAFQLIDANGKLPSGILEGTLNDLGRYDECIAVKHWSSTSSQEIKGQYCTVRVRPPLPPRPRFHTICNRISELVNYGHYEDNIFRHLAANAQNFYYVPLRIGICSPDVCSPVDVQHIVQRIFSEHFGLNATVSNCETSSTLQSPYWNKVWSLNQTQIGILIAFGFLIFLVLIGTLADLMNINEPSAKKLVQAITFSRTDPLNSKSKTGIYWFEAAPNLASSQSKPLNVSTSSASHASLSQVSPPPSYHLATPPHQVPSLSTSSILISILKCFSARKNAALILSMPNSDPSTSKNSHHGSSSSIDAIHGVRVLTMAWIIMAHTYGLVNPEVQTYVYSAPDMYGDFRIQGLLNATLAVDTFYFISGLLTIYICWSRMGDKFRPIGATVVRYLRITPAYAVTIGIAILYPLIGYGPLWTETTDAVAKPCYTQWWANLLYINNFVVENREMCLMHSWFLSNDFQFHIIAMILVWLLLKSRKAGFYAIGGLMMGSTILSAVLVYLNDYPPTIVTTSPAVEERWGFILDFYYKPWPHLPSYLIGFLMGYFLVTKTQIRLTRCSIRFCSTLATLAVFVVLYGIYPWSLGLVEIPPLIGTIYASTFRTIWTACCAWTVYLAIRYPKSLVGKILSWKCFLPFSRMTYCAYLIHPFVIWMHIGLTRERVTGTHYHNMHNFLGHYLMTYLISFFATLVIESPFLTLLKLIGESTGLGQCPKINVNGSTAASTTSTCPSEARIRIKEEDEDEDEATNFHASTATVNQSSDCSASNAPAAEKTLTNLISLGANSNIGTSNQHTNSINTSDSNNNATAVNYNHLNQIRSA